MREMPKVQYIRGWMGSVNYYDSQTNTIVLDETLKTLPIAHNHILSHELGHARIKGTDIIGHLRHEFNEDRKMFFSTNEEMERVRSYIDSLQSRTDPKKAMAVFIVSFVRTIWTPFFWVFGRIWRTMKR